MTESAGLDDDTLGSTEHVDRGYSVVEKPHRIWVTPDAGVASLEPARERRIPRYPRRDVPLPQTIASAKRRARRLLTNHALKENLRVCITLTYREEPDDPDRDIDAFIADAANFFSGKMHWAVVTVRASEDEHRSHHHLLIPPTLQIHKVASSWPHGDIHVGFNPGDDDVRRVARYLATNFPKTTVGGRYFRRSRGGASQTLRFDAASREEAELIVQSFVERGFGNAYAWDPKCGDRLIVYWDAKPRFDL